jgi:serine/threonine-protein kinase HipA
MNRKAKIFFNEVMCGTLEENDNGYAFRYEENYLKLPNAVAISGTLPLQVASFQSNVLFPFFDGLIPEGWLLDIAIDNWKINERDRMQLLLECCRDCIGAVSVLPL